jgi:hypothetical protein
VFLTSVLGGGECSASHPQAIIPEERAPSTHFKGSWVGPRASLDVVTKRKSPIIFNFLFLYQMDLIIP